MKYVSTRGQSPAVSSAEAILQGIAPDGGLYLPQDIPLLSAKEWGAVRGMDYNETACLVLSKYLDDFSKERIAGCVAAAYAPERFPGGPAPLVTLNNGVHMLELWHGPTCAFKDMALQLMPRLFVAAKDMLGDKRRALVLVATSGDTGKAALEGFRDMPGTGVAVLYPDDGVSDIQRLQMTTQQGDNVAAAAMHGNFDTAQSAVKAVFADTELGAELTAKGVHLSSANSINWGRLVPQIVYYVYACAQLQRQGLMEPGQKADICVPTGNFGNILAAYYAKRMGAPIGMLLCASNANKVLTDFINTGSYDSGRDFYKTLSPSMDILVSSNLERLLFLLSGGDGAYIASLMRQLSEEGRYTVNGTVRQALAESFAAGWCDDDGTSAEIGEVWRRLGYLLDPHTAVAYRVAAKLADCAPILVVSTASPFKFAPDVLTALGQPWTGDAPGAVTALGTATGVAPPLQLTGLSALPQRHPDELDPTQIGDWVRTLSGTLM